MILINTLVCCKDVFVSDILRQLLFSKHKVMIDKVTKRGSQIDTNGAQKR